MFCFSWLCYLVALLYEKKPQRVLSFPEIFPVLLLENVLTIQRVICRICIAFLGLQNPHAWIFTLLNIPPPPSLLSLFIYRVPAFWKHICPKEMSLEHKSAVATGKDAGSLFARVIFPEQIFKVNQKLLHFVRSH
jgi:hypothetical protein